jgi:hypothetical protein
VTAKIPGCGRVNCTSREPRHEHVWPPATGDRVVGVPKLVGAPGYLFSNPRGTVTASPAVHRRLVRFDDGALREVHIDNLAMAKKWRPPKPAKPKLLGRPAPAVDERHGVELDLFGGAS